MIIDFIVPSSKIIKYQGLYKVETIYRKTPEGNYVKYRDIDFVPSSDQIIVSEPGEYRLVLSEDVGCGTPSAEIEDVPTPCVGEDTYITGLEYTDDGKYTATYNDGTTVEGFLELPPETLVGDTRLGDPEVNGTIVTFPVIDASTGLPTGDSVELDLTPIIPEISFGTDNQIPYVNATGDDFDYSKLRHAHDSPFDIETTYSEAFSTNEDGTRKGEALGENVKTGTIIKDHLLISKNLFVSGDKVLRVGVFAGSEGISDGQGGFTPHIAPQSIQLGFGEYQKGSSLNISDPNLTASTDPNGVTFLTVYGVGTKLGTIPQFGSNAVVIGNSIVLEGAPINPLAIGSEINIADGSRDVAVISTRGRSGNSKATGTLYEHTFFVGQTQGSTGNTTYLNSILIGGEFRVADNFRKAEIKTSASDEPDTAGRDLRISAGASLGTAVGACVYVATADDNLVTGVLHEPTDKWRFCGDGSFESLVASSRISINDSWLVKNDIFADTIGALTIEISGTLVSRTVLYKTEQEIDDIVPLTATGTKSYIINQTDGQFADKFFAVRMGQKVPFGQAVFLYSSHESTKFQIELLADQVIADGQSLNIFSILDDSTKIKNTAGDLFSITTNATSGENQVMLNFRGDSETVKLTIRGTIDQSGTDFYSISVNNATNSTALIEKPFGVKASETTGMFDFVIADETFDNTHPIYTDGLSFFFNNNSGQSVTFPAGTTITAILTTTLRQ